MEEVKNKLSSGEFKTIQNEGKSTVWRYFRLVVNADFNVAVGYVQCRKCKVVMKYDSKRTGNSAMQRHVARVCKTTDDAVGQRSVFPLGSILKLEVSTLMYAFVICCGMWCTE